MDPKKLSMLDKSAVLALVQEGFSNRQIARKTERSEKSVRRVKRAASALGAGVTPEMKKGTGTKRKTNARTDTILQRGVIKDPYITAKEIKEVYATVVGDVSVRTIKERLQKSLNMQCRRAVHKLLLTDKMRKQWLDFCMRYRHLIKEEWRSVMKVPSKQSPKE